MKKLKLLLHAFFYVFILLLIIVMALGPKLFPLPTYYADKMLHILFCTLILIWIFFNVSSVKWRLFAALGLFIASIGVEIIQYNIPGRDFSPDDVVANAIGILCGLITGYLLKSGIDAGEENPATKPR